jgi:hypothetical protein
MVMPRWERASAGSETSALEAAVQHAVELAVGRLRLGRDATPNQVEEVVRLVDAGVLDAVIARNAPPVVPVAQPRGYADVKPFSHEAWKKRHGVKD